MDFDIFHDLIGSVEAGDGVAAQSGVTFFNMIDAAETPSGFIAVGIVVFPANSGSRSEFFDDFPFECGVETVADAAFIGANGIFKRTFVNLRINYRSSHQIRQQADRLLGPKITDVDGIREDPSDTIPAHVGVRMDKIDVRCRCVFPAHLP